MQNPSQPLFEFARQWSHGSRVLGPVPVKLAEKMKFRVHAQVSCIYVYAFVCVVRVYAHIMLPWAHSFSFPCYAVAHVLILLLPCSGRALLQSKPLRKISVQSEGVLVALLQNITCYAHRCCISEKLCHTATEHVLACVSSALDRSRLC